MKTEKVASAALIAGLLIASVISHKPASAQLSTSGTGPYYGTPSWDQKITAGRFVVLTNWNNQAVLDRETGLVWEKAPSTSTFPYYVDITSDSTIFAADHCSKLTTGNRRGWRLPAVQELASLIDADPANLNNPKLPPGHPFENVLTSLVYLSATPYSGDNTLVWAMSFRATSPPASLDLTGKTLPVLVWCVRGGQGVSPL